MNWSLITSLATASAVLALLIFGIGMLWLGNAVVLASGEAGQWRRRVLTVVGWLSLILGLLGLAAGMLMFIAIPLLVVMAVVLVVAVAWFRQSEADSLLWSLGLALHHRVNLEQAARSFAAERHDRLGRRARFLATRLAAGVPAPLALQAMIPSTDLDRRVLVELAGKLRTLPRELLIGDESGDEVKQTLLKFYETGFYLVAIIGLEFIMLMYFVAFVIPNLGLMLSDFSIPVPATIRRLVDFVPQDFGSSIVPGLIVLALWLIFSVSILGFIQSSIAFVDLPLVSRLGKSLDRTRILQALALGVEQQRPLDELCGMLAEIYPKKYLRRRLRRAADDMHQGRDAWNCLRRARLLHASDVHVLMAAQRVGNLPWVMRELAMTIRRRHANRLRVALQILLPLGVLSIAVLVLAITSSLFGMLAYLAESLSR